MRTHGRVPASQVAKTVLRMHDSMHSLLNFLTVVTVSARIYIQVEFVQQTLNAWSR